MEEPLEEFAGHKYAPSKVLTYLCNGAIIAGLFLLFACFLFIFRGNWRESLAAGLFTINGVLLFGFGLLGRILIARR